MNITKKTSTAIACSFALTMGVVIILVFLTMLLPFQKMIDPYILFFFSLIVVLPLLYSRLNRIEEQNKIFGWTFIGLGVQLLVLPLPIVLIMLKFPSTAGFLFGGLILTGSAVFGIPAGLITIAAGVFLVKRHRFFTNTHSK
ncbi:MAG: hypothetical protein Q7J35_18110 [Candidatus Methanoperedens sp.]|nr:hypothetical protein [Candidatus Methanoperedens sp.]